MSHDWLTFCANSISGKILILEIYWWKLSTNQIAGFFKLLYLLNGLTVCFIFLHKDRRLRQCCHFSVKMPFCPEKGQKGGKVGGAVGQNKLFCILLNIGSFDFFDILHEVRDH